MPAYRFPPPPHQAPNVRGVPPSSLHLVRPMSQQQVPGTAQMQGMYSNTVILGSQDLNLTYYHFLGVYFI